MDNPYQSPPTSGELGVEPRPSSRLRWVAIVICFLLGFCYLSLNGIAFINQVAHQEPLVTEIRSDASQFTRFLAYVIQPILASLVLLAATGLSATGFGILRGANWARRVGAVSAHSYEWAWLAMMLNTVVFGTLASLPEVNNLWTALLPNLFGCAVFVAVIFLAMLPVLRWCRTAEAIAHTASPQQRNSE